MKNPFAGGTLWILVRCTIDVFGMADRRPAGLEAGYVNQAERRVRTARPKALFWWAACSIP
jgi:hypothetical protein